MENPAGIFYGVGVGPGDPDLMTIKALKVLKGSAVLAVPRSADSSPEGLSQALSIVKKAVDLEGKEILELLFPMTKDRDVLREARKAAALAIAERLKRGQDVCFITLGDPMLYSTFSYLMPFIREALPGADIKAVPGVTSFSAASSAAVLPLAESDEKVIIIPAAYDIGEVRKAIDRLSGAGTIVLMKVNRVMDALIAMLSEARLADKALFVSRAGWPGEEIVTGIKSLKGRKLDYFSIVIIKKD